MQVLQLSVEPGGRKMQIAISVRADARGYVLWLAVIVLCLVLASAVEVRAEERVDSLGVSMIIQPDPIDPVYTTTVENYLLMANLFEPLVLDGEFGEVQPGQAESWTISEDGLRYRFTLRQGLLWRDGQPVTAQDFVTTFQRVVDPNVNLKYKANYLLSNILNARAITAGQRSVDELGARALDDRTLEIQLETPASFFLNVLVYPGFGPTPTHLLHEYGDNWWQVEPFVSNGPYHLSRRQGLDQFELQVNPQHWYQAKSDRLIYRYFHDQNDMLRELLTGELDIAIAVSLRNQPWLSQSPLSERQYTMNLAGTQFATLNTVGKLSDPRIRKALNMAIDRRLLSRELGFGEQSYSKTFTPNLLYFKDVFFEPEWLNEEQDQRLAVAREMLASAGYGQDNRLQLEFVVGERDQKPQIANAFRAMWNAVGVDTDVVLMESDEEKERKINGEFDVTLKAWIADFNDPIAFLNTMNSQSSVNTSRWENQRFDELLDLAMRENLRSKRDKYYKEMEFILSEESPVIPIYTLQEKIVYSEKIQNFLQNSIYLQIPRDVVLVEKGN